MVNHSQFGMELFCNEASVVIERVIQTQSAVIRQAAELFAACIEQNGVIQAYGTGHSRAFTMELAGRAGGLVPINRMDLEDLALRANWSLERVMSPEIEREPEAGQAILDCYRIEPQDVFIITSNSGVNTAIVEVAQQVKQRGHALVVVTSFEHSQKVPSRHASGKKLYELADVVIDNCGPYGDAILELSDGIKACAASSISGALIAQMLTAETIGILLAQGKEAPVYISANVPGGIERNKQTIQRYAGRIRAA